MYGEDKPDDSVINDDPALDNWYKRYSQEREQKMSGGRATGSQDAMNAIPAFKPTG